MPAVSDDVASLFPLSAFRIPTSTSQNRSIPSNSSALLETSNPVHPPPTIIVVHPKERRSKCTVEPLRGREGFVFWKYPRVGEQSLEHYVRLGFGGPLLSRDDASRGLLVLDGTWRWADAMERDFADVPVRSLPEWKTAYPRVSKTLEYPAPGMATI